MLFSALIMGRLMNGRSSGRGEKGEGSGGAAPSLP